MDINDSNFKSEVLESKALVFVDFWAEWCGPCRIQGPIIEKLAEEYKGNEKVKFMKMDVDENPSTAEAYQIMSIPTLGVFKDGQRIANLVGLQGEQKIKDTLASLA